MTGTPTLFVDGIRYTMADISALVLADFAGRLKLEIPPECANLRRWYAVVAACETACTAVAAACAAAW